MSREQRINGTYMYTVVHGLHVEIERLVKVTRLWLKDMSANCQQSYGIKCEPDTLTFLNSSEPFHQYSDPLSDVNSERHSPHINPAVQQELPVSDMDLTGFIDMDDKSLSGIQLSNNWFMSHIRYIPISKSYTD